MKMELAGGDETPLNKDDEWTNHGGHFLFDCSICLDPAAGEPVVTPCGHLYCGSCMRRWMRSGQPGAQRCPVCKAAVSEDRLVRLYGLQQPRRRCNDQGWVLLHSNAGRVISMLPTAFTGSRLPLPPRPAITCNDGLTKAVGNSLHQLWRFLAVASLLCFLLI